MAKLKKNVNINDLLILIIMLIVAITSLIVYIRATSSSGREDGSTPNTPTVTIETKNETPQKPTSNSSKEDIKKYLSSLGEASRMKYYCGEYIKLLKHQEYEQAYSLLYGEFKENYFPTLESFKKYAKSAYPSMFAVEYDDISRQGDIYVLRLKIIDASSSEQNKEVVQRVVIKENDLDDFVLSFQVKNTDK